MLGDPTPRTETSTVAILDQAPVGLFRADAAGRCRYVNDRWCEIAGMSSEEAMGEGWVRALHPQDRAAFVEGWMNAVRDQVPSSGKVRFGRGEGTPRWISGKAVPERNADGEVVGYIGAIFDITARTRAEDALARSEEFLSATGRMAKVGGWELEAKTRAVRWTRETYRIHEVPEGTDPALEKALDFYHPKDRPRLARAIERALDAGEPYDLELRLITATGKHLWVRTLCQPEVVDGKTVRLFGTFQDITERRQAEAVLRQAQKMEAVGQLAGGVAHDFNNVLQAILGYQELAARALPQGHAARDDLDKIRQAANRAVVLTRQLLAFSRRQVLQPQDVDLNKLIRSQIEVIGRMIGETVELVFVPGDDLSTIHADPVLLEQVLINLCVNARDAMPSGGRLVIETCDATLGDEAAGEHPSLPPGPYVRLTLTDEGCGMGEEIRQRIFEPFFSTKDPGKGSGLGLATALGIVEQHDGVIEVSSELGAGTSFDIYLPAVDRPASPARHLVPGSPARGSETILVAEDNAAVRVSSVRVLQEAGYTVLVASDGEEALALYTAHPGKVSLAVLDVVMPKLTGPEVSDRIREIDPELQVVFLSGYSPTGIHTQFVLDEGVHLLRKPCEPQVLLGEIREILDGSA